MNTNEPSIKPDIIQMPLGHVINLPAAGAQGVCLAVEVVADVPHSVVDAVRLQRMRGAARCDIRAKEEGLG